MSDNDILTPERVERGIRLTLNRLQDAVGELRTMADEAAQAEVAYKVKFSQERLKARTNQSVRKITVDECEDWAVEATKDELLDYKIKTNRHQTQREVIRSLQAQLDGLRTLSAGLRPLTN